MSRMINMGVFNASSKFESQVLILKQDTEFNFFCKQSSGLVIVYIYL